MSRSAKTLIDMEVVGDILLKDYLIAHDDNVITKRYLINNIADILNLNLEENDDIEKLIHNIIKNSLLDWEVYTTTITTNGIHREYKIIHDLETKNVTVQVYDAVTGKTIDDVQVNRDTKNSCVIIFPTILPVNQSFCVCVLASSQKTTFGSGIDSAPNPNPGGPGSIPQIDPSIYTFIINGNGVDSEYTVAHNLNTRKLLVQVYKLIDGTSVKPEVSRHTSNLLKVKFTNILPNDEKYMVLVVDTSKSDTNPNGGGEAPDNPNPGGSGGTTTQITPIKFIEITADGVNTDFAVVHNMNTKNVVIQVFKQSDNSTIYPLVTRQDNNQAVIKFGSAPVFNERYTCLVMNCENSSNIPFKFKSSDITCDGTNQEYIVTHNLNAQHVLVQVVNANTGQTVLPYITRIDNNSLKVRFPGTPPSSTNYRIFTVESTTKSITDSANAQVRVSCTEVITCNGTDAQYSIQHSLNAKNVMVQVYDVGTKQDVEPYVLRNSNNTVLVKFNSAPPNGKRYAITILSSRPYVISTGGGSGSGGSSNPPVSPPPTGTSLIKAYTVGITTTNTTKEYRINHTLNTKNILIQMYNMFSNKTIESPLVSYVYETNNTILVKFRDMPTDQDKFHVLLIENENRSVSHAGITKIVQKVGTFRGNGANDTYTYTHDLNSRDVVVQVYNVNTLDSVDIVATRTDNNNVSIKFPNAAPINDFNVLVLNKVTRDDFVVTPPPGSGGGSGGSGGGSGSGSGSGSITMPIVPGSNIVTPSLTYASFIVCKATDLSYTVQHNLHTRNVVVQMYDNDTSLTVPMNQYEVVRDTEDTVVITFLAAQPNDKKYTVMIADSRDRNIILAGQSVKVANTIELTGTGSMSQFLLPHTLKTKDVIIQVIHPVNGKTIVDAQTTRSSENAVEITLPSNIPHGLKYHVLILNCDRNIAILSKDSLRRMIYNLFREAILYDRDIKYIITELIKILFSDSPALITLIDTIINNHRIAYWEDLRP